MKLDGNTILLTGGSSGIGLALAERFAKSNRVIVTGRRADALEQVSKQVPGVTTIVSDAGRASDREQLAREVIERFPEMNVLINNAGIQQQMDLADAGVWPSAHEEIAINLEGPIHLASLFTKHLATKTGAAILNVSSGLAFVPLARVPVYSATKAALHSYTLSLRHQLAKKGIEVIEIVPPAVRSNLGGSHDFGVPTGEYADSVMAQLAEGRTELTYDFSTKSSQASRAELDAIFARMNGG